MKARQRLGIKAKLYTANFKTRQEAKQAELEFDNRMKRIAEHEDLEPFELLGETLFSDFYEKIWKDAYIAGQTTNYATPPTSVTIENMEILFKYHILPIFGQYSLNYLNTHKSLVIQLLTRKANEYANFKVIRSYTNSLFVWAEELEYIELNRLSKSIKRIKATKKIRLQEEKDEEDLYQSVEQLQDWLEAVETDFNNHLLELKDYVLFHTTLILSDRKSETYGLQWKHIDFEQDKIAIVQALDRYGKVKKTKGKKKTIFKVTPELMNLLKQWKIKQSEELLRFGIRQSPLNMSLPILILREMSTNPFTQIISIIE